MHRYSVSLLVSVWSISAEQEFPEVRELVAALSATACSDTGTAMECRCYRGGLGSRRPPLSLTAIAAMPSCITLLVRLLPASHSPVRRFFDSSSASFSPYFELTDFQRRGLSSCLLQSEPHRKSAKEQASRHRWKSAQVGEPASLLRLLLEDRPPLSAAAPTRKRA